MLNEDRYKQSRKARNTVWFHGTDSGRIKSILAQGLTDRVKHKAWGHDEAPLSRHQLDRRSYGGVYVTRNLTTATSSADRAARAAGYAHKGTAVAFVKAHPRSLARDEDSFANRLKGMPPVPGLVNDSDHQVLDLYARHFSPHSRASSLDLHKDRTAYADHHMENLSSGRHGLLLSQKGREHLHSVLRDHVFPAAVKRAAAHVDSWARSYYRDSIHPHVTQSKGTHDLPDPREAEEHYRAAIDRVTRITGKPPTDSTWDNARSLSPIGFKGKKKVIGVVSMRRPTRSEYADILRQFKAKIGLPPGTVRKYQRPSEYTNVITKEHGRIPPEFWREYAERKGSHAAIRTSKGLKLVSLSSRRK